MKMHLGRHLFWGLLDLLTFRAVTSSSLAYLMARLLRYYRDTGVPRLKSDSSRPREPLPHEWGAAPPSGSSCRTSPAHPAWHTASGSVR